MATRRRGIALVALAALATWSGTASAKPYVERKGFRAELTLKASNGYEIEVNARGNGRIKLTAFKGNAGQGALGADYTTTGRVTGTEIVARFGRLGRVSVSLDPNAEAKTGSGLFPPSFCRGRDPIVREGRWHGRIAFRGERGYTRVLATHAKGKTVRRFRRVCGAPSMPRGDSRASQLDEAETTIRLLAVRRTDGRRVTFGSLAGRGELGDVLIFYAEASERKEGIAVRRTALALIEGSDRFAVSDIDERPRWAEVAPPAPFKGSAEFQEGSGSRSTWVGSLRVPLPGLRTVDLTGRRFRASICEVEEDVFEEQCPEPS